MAFTSPCPRSGIYVTLPKEFDPLDITFDEAVALLKDKLEAEAKRHIKKFPEEPELEIMNGRYGPYIAYQGHNYKIPAGIEPADLSLASLHPQETYAQGGRQGGETGQDGEGQIEGSRRVRRRGRYIFEE